MIRHAADALLQRPIRIKELVLDDYTMAWIFRQLSGL